MLILARHAHAGDKAGWRPRPDQLRPLSDLGLQQAAGLARTLAPWRVTRIVSSPYERCTQTVAPLARQLGLEVVTDPELRPKAKGEELISSAAAAPDEVLLLCTHGETIARLLHSWGRRRTVRLPLERSRIGKGSTEKGAAWVVVDDGDGPVAHYLPPLLADPALVPRLITLPDAVPSEPVRG